MEGDDGGESDRDEDREVVCLSRDIPDLPMLLGEISEDASLVLW